MRDAFENKQIWPSPRPSTLSPNLQVSDALLLGSFEELLEIEKPTDRTFRDCEYSCPLPLPMAPHRVCMWGLQYKKRCSYQPYTLRSCPLCPAPVPLANEPHAVFHCPLFAPISDPFLAAAAPLLSQHGLLLSSLEVPGTAAIAG